MSVIQDDAQLTISALIEMLNLLKREGADPFKIKGLENEIKVFESYTQTRRNQEPNYPQR